MRFQTYFIYASLLSAICSSGLTLADDHFPEILDVTALKDGLDGRPQVNPCDDFYEFACGNWMDTTVIPANKRSVNRQVTALSDLTDKNLNKILEAYVKGDYSLPATNAKKMANLYSSCMAAEKTHWDSLFFVKTKIFEISLTHSTKQLAKLVAELHLSGSGPLFSFGSTQDLNDSTKVIGDASQGGISLGDRDYYFNDDAKSKEIREHYREHISKMFQLLGAKPEKAEKISQTILRMETFLADKSYSIAEASDPSKTNHPMDLPALKKLAPHFAWDQYFSVLGAKGLDHINVDEPEFFQNLDLLLAKESRENLHHYMTWFFINSIADKLGGDFEKEDFAFWHAYLNGSKQMLPRWQHCTKVVEDNLGYALAEAYVKTFDGAAIKAKTNQMIDQIKAAFSNDLDNLTHGVAGWMDEATLLKALEKVQLVDRKIGAPEKWRDYSKLSQSPKNYLQNSLRIARFESRRQLDKIGQPVDKSEWGMMPWEVNAYYDRSNNEFVFPFGILQPPSMDLTASDGANFGAFGGGTIGHELTHGFDNNGSQYDAHGNLVNWWTPETLDKFKAKAACYVNQANAYKIQAVGINVDGEQTLEENLADQGGVKLGYIALDSILSKRAEGAPWAGKYNERQQYWIGYAQSWCTKITPESLRAQMTTDVHPPAEFRVNAVVMNRPEFAKDFGCAEGSPMAPSNRCSLW